MTWAETIVAILALAFTWAVGIVLLQFPEGLYAILLRKQAQRALRHAEACERNERCPPVMWHYLHVRTPLGEITLYEVQQQLARDPADAVRTYFPWQIPLVHFLAFVWLGSAAWVTVVLLRVLIYGEWALP